MQSFASIKITNKKKPADFTQRAMFFIHFINH